MGRRKAKPLVDALIRELPDPDADWPMEKQQAWLEMMAIAFKITYGGSVSAGNGAAPEPEEPKQPEHPFIIDEKGYVVRTKDGERMLPGEVSGETLFDTRGMDADLDAIIWADDMRGLAGSDIQIQSA